MPISNMQLEHVAKGIAAFVEHHDRKCQPTIRNVAGALALADSLNILTARPDVGAVSFTFS